jgi:hypothetical protein
MTRMRSPLRLLGFLLIPAISAVSPLLALPAVSAKGGASVWAAIAIGQSIGIAGATIVELGWGLTGPQRVSRASQGNRRRALSLSLQSRLLIFPLVAALAATSAWFLAVEHRELSAVTAVASSATGLSLIWFFIGIGAPGRLLLTDALPRLALVSASALAISNGAPIMVYPIVGLLVPALLAPLLGSLNTRIRFSDFRGISLKRTLLVVRIQAVAMSGRLVSALYIALPITLVSLVAPQAVPVFAAAERLQRMYLSILAAIPNVLQSWVGRPASRMRRLNRAEISVGLNASVGILAGLIFAVIAPSASRFVFSGQASISTELAWLCAGVIFLVCCSRAVGGLVLVALGRFHSVATSAVVGAVVGVPLILLLASRLGASGGLLGELIAESAVLCVQTGFWLRFRSKITAHQAPAWGVRSRIPSVRMLQRWRIRPPGQEQGES